MNTVLALNVEAEGEGQAVGTLRPDFVIPLSGSPGRVRAWAPVDTAAQLARLATLASTVSSKLAVQKSSGRELQR